MKWIEIIKLRGTGIEEGLLEELLRSLRSDRGIGLVKTETYRHPVLENDLSVHLRWESEQLAENGSALGLRLVQGFKEFGLVDHSIWVEVEK